MAHEGRLIGTFIRQLSPKGVQVIDKLCDIIDKLGIEPTDPRAAAVLQALRAGCVVRKRLRKE